MSKKRDKDELIFPTKEEMDKESEKFNDLKFRVQNAKKFLATNIFSNMLAKCFSNFLATF